MPDSLPPASASPQTALDWARFYAGLGWSVVPVRRGEKIPAEKWARYQSLPADANQILAWWADRPDFGVGLIQGQRAGTIVLDFDGAIGAETLAQLDARGLPSSCRAYTPGGGVHVILRHPGAYVPTRKGVLAGMDVRGDGGFIVACPSFHANGGQYVWDVDCHPEDVPVADCPAWLLDTITGDAPPLPGTPGDVVRVAQQSGPLGLAMERVTDGREQYMRDTILAVCRDLRDQHQRTPTEAELFDAAWPQYLAHVDLSRPGRGEAEFRAKVRYTLARVEAGRVRGFDQPGQAGQTPDVPAVPAIIRPANGLPLVYWHDIQPSLAADDFIEGLLIKGAMSVVYGPSNCGKTFWTSDLAMHVATGRRWQGRDIEPGGVIYCALEGGHGIRNRVAAWRKHYGLEGVEVPFAIIPVTLNLLDPDADASRVVEAIEAAKREFGLPVAWTIMDTLSRAMAGGNENSPEDMGALVTNGTMIQQTTGSHLTWIHHSGKDQAQGARGHSLLRAATDTEIEISRASKDSPSVAKVTKQREMEIEGEWTFGLQAIELGKNRRGKAVTSCIVTEATAEPDATRSLPAGAKAGLAALHEALIKAGQRPVSRDIPEWARVAPLEAWRREFYARSHLDSPEARRKAFQRAVKDLRDAELVGVMHDQAWLTQRDA